MEKKKLMSLTETNDFPYRIFLNLRQCRFVHRQMAWFDICYSKHDRHIKCIFKNFLLIPEASGNKTRKPPVEFAL